MIAFEIRPEDEPEIMRAIEQYPGKINRVKSRQIYGAGSDLTFFVGATGLAIGAIRLIIVEMIRSNRFKSISYKGVKYQGYSASDAVRLIEALGQSEGKDGAK